MQKWESLSNKEKLDHRIHDCPPCEHSKLLNYSVLHKSATESTKNLIHLSNEIVNELDNKNNIGVNNILNVFEPIFDEKFQTNLKTVVSKRYNLTKKLPSEQKRKQKTMQTRENTNKINKIITNNENELQNFLASGKSYSQFDRDRLGMFFEKNTISKGENYSYLQKNQGRC